MPVIFQACRSPERIDIFIRYKELTENYHFQKLLFSKTVRIDTMSNILMVCLLLLLIQCDTRDISFYSLRIVSKCHF